MSAPARHGPWSFRPCPDRGRDTDFPGSKPTVFPADRPWLIVGLMVMVAVAVLAILGDPWAAGLVAGCLLGSLGSGVERQKVVASLELDGEGRPRHFLLRLGHESTVLEPGHTWNQIDHFKWVTRGIIEPPQSFAVHADGSVDLNGVAFAITDPESAAALSEKINQHHTSTGPTRPKGATRTLQPAPSDRVTFKVRLDPLGHLLVSAARGADRVETGLRGLGHLSVDGWMSRPAKLHVDPLQRYVEIDEVRFDCTPEGAVKLEAALNARYAPAPGAVDKVAIEIRENPAAATGFDIHFWTVRAGTRFEIKGHLSQDKLDILQDHDKCDLLQPGIILRLSPPYLYIRRRRPDGGEERVSAFPDVKYRAISAPELQRLLNHPLIRQRTASAAEPEAATGHLPSDLARIEVTRHPSNSRQLWLELIRLEGSILTRVLTHHNFSDLVQQGIFRPDWELHLGIDQGELRVRPGETAPWESLRLEVSSPDDDLRRAGDLLTRALKEPVPATPTPKEPKPSSTLVPPAESQPPAALPPRIDAPPRPMPSATVAMPSPPPGPKASPPAAEVPRPDFANPPPAAPAAPAAPADDGFAEVDPHHAHESVFRQLIARFGIPVQDLLLDLPRVFTNRRFEVLDFTGAEIESVLQLRSDRFYGFYLTHLGADRVDLVYACRGTHIEWGTDKCVLQPTVGSESHEFRGAALRGLAQDANQHFVFLVDPRYREWVKPHEKACAEALAHFLTVDEWRAKAADYPLLWPARATDSAG